MIFAAREPYPRLIDPNHANLCRSAPKLKGETVEMLFDTNEVFKSEYEV